MAKKKTAEQLLKMKPEDLTPEQVLQLKALMASVTVTISGVFHELAAQLQQVMKAINDIYASMPIEVKRSIREGSIGDPDELINQSVEDEVQERLAEYEKYKLKNGWYNVDGLKMSKPTLIQEIERGIRWERGLPL